MQAKLTNSRQKGVQTLELDFSYRKIPYELRKQLIELVTQQGCSVYRASKQLKINNSTAKAIIRKYRKDGTIYLRRGELPHSYCPQPLRATPGLPPLLQNQSDLQSPSNPGKELPGLEEVPFYFFYTFPLESCFGMPPFMAPFL